jgi:hypothetical protein
MKAEGQFLGSNVYDFEALNCQVITDVKVRQNIQLTTESVFFYKRLLQPVFCFFVIVLY